MFNFPSNWDNPLHALQYYTVGIPIWTSHKTQSLGLCVRERYAHSVILVSTQVQSHALLCQGFGTSVPFITTAAEPSFPYCPSSCYGNLFYGTSLWQSWSICWFTILLTPPSPSPTHFPRIPSPCSHIMITVVNPNEVRLSVCVHVCVYLCAMAV